MSDTVCHAILYDAKSVPVRHVAQFNSTYQWIAYGQSAQMFVSEGKDYQLRWQE